MILKSAVAAQCTPPEKEACADHLQTDLNSLSTWSGDWRLKFNASKCSSLHFDHGNVAHQYFVSGQQRCPKSQFCGSESNPDPKPLLLYPDPGPVLLQEVESWS